MIWRRSRPDHPGRPLRRRHLVALLATDPRYLQDPELKLQDRDRAAIRGVIARRGVYRIPDPDEFVEMMREMARACSPWAGCLAVASATLMPSLMRSGKDINPFRMVFGDDRDVRKDASPRRPRPQGPAAVPAAAWRVGHCRVCDPMAREFRDALQKAGSPVELCPIEGHSHNTIVFPAQPAQRPHGQGHVCSSSPGLNEAISP